MCAGRAQKVRTKHSIPALTVQLRLQVCMSHTLRETEAPSQNKLHRHLRRNFAMICSSLSKSPWRSYNPHPWPYKSVLAHLFSLSFSTPATLASFLFLECFLSFVILFFSLWCGLPHCSLPCPILLKVTSKVFPLHPIQNVLPLTLSS